MVGQSPAAQAPRPPVDQQRIAAAVREILEAIGEDPDREGLRDTPARVARFWDEFLGFENGMKATTFKQESIDQMVVLQGIEVWSLCEHHLLPFSCDITAAYITNGKVIGISKIARLARRVAAKPNVQERLVHDLASAIHEVTDSPDVAVAARGHHLCMAMRGVRSNAAMHTNVLRGRFKDSPAARAEFMGLGQ